MPSPHTRHDFDLERVMLSLAGIPLKADFMFSTCSVRKAGIVKKESKLYFRRIIVLLAVGGLCIGTLDLTPISSNFFRYMIWRMTSTASTLKGHVMAGDVEIHYVSYGNGPAVLLLHGGLNNRLGWFSQLHWLVDSGRRVVLPDIRGHGHSGLGDGELTYRLLAAAAIEILDKLSIEQVDVVSISHARQMAEKLADGSLAVIPGGHFTPITQARRVNGLIAEFLGIGSPP